MMFTPLFSIGSKGSTFVVGLAVGSLATHEVSQPAP